MRPHTSSTLYRCKTNSMKKSEKEEKLILIKMKSWTTERVRRTCFSKAQWNGITSDVVSSVMFYFGWWWMTEWWDVYGVFTFWFQLKFFWMQRSRNNFTQSTAAVKDCRLQGASPIKFLLFRIALERRCMGHSEVLVQAVIYWAVTPYSLVIIYQCFGGTRCSDH
jgi:hypothetical protein